ncbi:hypothetical protein VSR68_28710 [Paraburkholderia phymatum]|uniref:hypothetical protein n=1 Tax=Paraburkholderia phymatum TaxID=148447 RepID=UPI0031717D27
MSYNSLNVPLNIGTWQCMLVLASEFYSSSGGFWDPFTDGDTRRERERQIEDDKSAFERYFRPNYDFRRTIRADIDAIGSFLSQHLNVAHWNLPTDNAGIERALKQAVRNEMLVPVINRDWRSLPQTYRPMPVPLHGPSASGGGASGNSGSTTWAAFRDAGPGLLIWDGEPVLRGPYDPSTVESQLKAARAALNTSVGNDDNADDVTSTLLGDEQPFEYSEDGVSDDAQDIAARGVSEEQEARCFAQYERDIDECTAYRSAMGGQRFMDACSQRAFMNYQECRGY